MNTGCGVNNESGLQNHGLFKKNWSVCAADQIPRGLPIGLPRGARGISDCIKLGGKPGTALSLGDARPLLSLKELKERAFRQGLSL